jgi:hypothetical protein
LFLSLFFKDKNKEGPLYPCVAGRIERGEINKKEGIIDMLNIFVKPSQSSRCIRVISAYGTTDPLLLGS